MSFFPANTSQTVRSPEQGQNEDKPLIVVDASKASLGIDVQEWLRCKDIFYFLVWRDILVRYKQTMLGAAWAVLRPLITMLVFTIFLGYVVKFPSDDIPYPLFYYSGLVIWGYFSTAVVMSSESLVGHSHLLTKVYLPRLFIPAAPIVSTLLDLFISFGLLILMSLYYGYGPSLRLLVIPVVFVIAIISALGASLLVSPLVVRYRDFQSIMGITIQIWMFVSPVIYPYSMVPDQWKFLYGLNPLVGAIEGLRWALYGTSTNLLNILPGGLIIALAAMLIGLIHFRKTEEYFADFV